MNTAPYKPKVSVLVVEDDRFFHTILAQSLSCYKLASVNKNFCERYDRAMGDFSQLKPDIVFLDINIPGGSGLDLLKQMMSLRPSTYAVMMTGMRDKQSVLQAQQNGAQGYIVKPFNTKRVHNVLNAYLEVRKQ